MNEHPFKWESGEEDARLNALTERMSAAFSGWQTWDVVRVCAVMAAYGCADSPEPIAARRHQLEVIIRFMRDVHERAMLGVDARRK